MWETIPEIGYLDNLLGYQCDLLLPSSGNVFELQILSTNIDSKGVWPVQPIFLMHMSEILIII